ncbi:MAG: Peptidyl-prolyl cis-trans isomerase [Candidatus Uhrbacteria bacterium GW2011_GWF2_41_16]|uniref:Peptidyl-prolyl cis-trans isomerase n=2 Tax=Candidatus Uhriibacteriota TaxID=1752732 RepID=A0A0G0VG02_9BACT|nr:MAG: Peptidyl-prolyl cis-trans isomerase [Candidatus Uhrbacteria bacterium GW2011_GWA2_41_10]KKR87596.1 MAG: Peptidyl-prolyl cis-trans isomerase [Candidatus Uhrbacteria bacterium GW2011_GWC2_41_11]KKR98576.1 MAG: Peptidyl-prolyl cis-trans isomerase [Candidatus Uhrbacteria bacterium GW2011_GWF2_41_16]
MKMQYVSLFLTLLVLTGTGCSSLQVSQTENKPPSNTSTSTNTSTSMNTDKNVLTPVVSSFSGVLSAEQIQNKQIHIKTAKGDIVFELFPDTAPLAVSNFVSLTDQGFYNGLSFHRREEGFVIQGGDPNGNGTGGPGYTFADELRDDYTYQKGMVAMANRGPDTNGSQFFIMLADYPLPKNYTIFGRVILGMDVVSQIQVGDKMESVTIEAKAQ